MAKDTDTFDMSLYNFILFHACVFQTTAGREVDWSKNLTAFNQILHHTQTITSKNALLSHY